MHKKFSADKLFHYKGKFCQIVHEHLPDGFELHTHDYIEIVVGLEGSANHIINNMTLPMSAGDIFIINGNTTHGYTHASDDFTIYNVAFDENSLPLNRLKHIIEYNDLFIFKPNYDKSQDYQCRLTISPIELCEVLKHIRKLCVEIADKSLGYDCMLQAGITELVIMLCRIYKLKNQSSNISRMNAVISYIESNFLSPITVEKLLTICQMSRRNFFRKFKQITGKSPIEYILELRLQEAVKIMLSNPELSIIDISFAAGFEDSSYFSKQFRRHYDCSPNEYRKSRA